MHTNYIYTTPRDNQEQEEKLRGRAVLGCGIGDLQGGLEGAAKHNGAVLAKRNLG